MKKFIMILVSVMMIFSLAACGSSNSSDDSGDTANEASCVTLEKYKALDDEDWGNMTKEDMEAFFDVKGVTDEESTQSWGEGYEVVDFPGPDEDSYLHVLFKQDSDGVWGVASMSPTGCLTE